MRKKNYKKPVFNVDAFITDCISCDIPPMYIIYSLATWVQDVIGLPILGVERMGYTVRSAWFRPDNKNSRGVK